MKCKNYLNLLFCLAFFCCQNEKGKEIKFEYYKNGKVKTKTILGDTLKIKKFYNNENNSIEMDIVTLNDSIKDLTYYSERGQIRKSGFMLNDSLIFGKWNFYSENFIEETLEFIMIDSKPYLNQNWIFNKKSDTIGGNHYQIKFQDTVIADQNNRVHLFLKGPTYSQESKIFLLVPSHNNFFNQDFSNFSDIKIDTVKSLSEKQMTDKRYKDFNHDILFDVFSKEFGENEFKAILIEKAEDAGRTQERKYYINISYYVKPE